MKAKEIASIGVTVVFRMAAVSVALIGAFLVLAPPLMMGVFPLSPILVRMVIIYFGAAVVLWLLAKPIASLVVRGLEDEPKS